MRVARTLSISEVTKNALIRLVQLRPRFWANKVPIFCTESGNKLNRHVWGDHLEHHSKSLGVHIPPL